MDYKVITASRLRRFFLIISMALVAILITACGTPETELETGDRAPDSVNSRCCCTFTWRLVDRLAFSRSLICKTTQIFKLSMLPSSVLPLIHPRS